MGPASPKSIFSLAFTPLKLRNKEKIAQFAELDVRNTLWTIYNIASGQAV
jgi:hypothetical protein